MKKSFLLTLASVLVIALCACGSAKEDPSTTPAPTNTSAPSNTPAPSEDSKNVMTYEQYIAAELQTEVCVETYVQAHQSWWENKLTIYAADEKGAYFIYEAKVDEELSKKLVPGTKIRVEGVKAAWKDEVEITDATITILEGSYTATATDATSKFGKNDELVAIQNFLVSFKDLTVVAKDGKGSLYKWDGSGVQGDDLYFDVTDGTTTVTFTVESYLCGKDTDVYKAVEAFKGGEKIDAEGFLYWYNGAQPHITKVTVK